MSLSLNSIVRTVNKIAACAIIMAAISAAVSCTSNPTPPDVPQSTVSNNGVTTESTTSIATEFDPEDSSENDDSLQTDESNDLSDTNQEMGSHTTEQTLVTDETECTDKTETITESSFDTTDESQDEISDTDSTEIDNDETSDRESSTDETSDCESTDEAQQGEDDVTQPPIYDETEDDIGNGTDSDTSEDTTESDVEQTTQETESSELDEMGFEYVLNPDGESYAIKGKTSLSGALVVIPERYNGKPVTVILDQAFKNSGVTSIKIGKNITKIGSGIFDGCSGLSIYFEGTKSDWIAIQKDKEWASGINKYTIYPLQSSTDRWEIPIG